MSRVSQKSILDRNETSGCGVVVVVVFVGSGVTCYERQQRIRDAIVTQLEASVRYLGIV